MNKILFEQNSRVSSKREIHKITVTANPSGVVGQAVQGGMREVGKSNDVELVMPAMETALGRVVRLHEAHHALQSHSSLKIADRKRKTQICDLVNQIAEDGRLHYSMKREGWPVSALVDEAIVSARGFLGLRDEAMKAHRQLEAIREKMGVHVPLPSSAVQAVLMEYVRNRNLLGCIQAEKQRVYNEYCKQHTMEEKRLTQARWKPLKRAESAAQMACIKAMDAIEILYDGSPDKLTGKSRRGKRKRLERMQAMFTAAADAMRLIERAGRHSIGVDSLGRSQYFERKKKIVSAMDEAEERLQAFFEDDKKKESDQNKLATAKIDELEKGERERKEKLDYDPKTDPDNLGDDNKAPVRLIHSDLTNKASSVCVVNTMRKRKTLSMAGATIASKRLVRFVHEGGECRPFTSHKREAGGVFLLDASCSMHIASDDIKTLIEHSPSVECYAYCSDGNEDENGNIIGAMVCLARNGRMAEDLESGLMDAIAECPGGGGGNVVDGAAISWAIRHAKTNKLGKVTFVTDEGFGGGPEHDTRLACQLVSAAMAQPNNETLEVINTIEEAIKLFTSNKGRK